jgi:cell division protein ZapA
VTTDSPPITVQILDKDYRVACQEGQEEPLLASARYLDQKMREIRAGGKVIGTDRIAVMAALNLAHELLEYRREREVLGDNFGKRLKSLKDKIEIALNQSNQLEL